MLRGKGASRRRDYIFCLKEEKIAGKNRMVLKCAIWIKKREKEAHNERLERSILNRKGTQK
jgi:hypothetical protein